MRANRWGRLRILRFLMIGWTLQSIHVLDRTEKLFRIVLEGALFILISIYYSLYVSQETIYWSGYVIILIIIHSLMFLFNSACLVGLRECFKFVKNPGIEKTISFLLLAKRMISATDSAECILVYGSLARKMFHNRSDLDVRIVQRGSLRQLMHIMLIAIGLRTIAVWYYHIPLDLKVVDSLEFLRNEMRVDEKPIVVYCRHDFKVYNSGINLEEVINNPSMVMKYADLRE